MEEVYYSLRIKAPNTLHRVISQVLGKPLDDFSRGWIFEVKQEDNYFDFIEFLNILEGHYNDLEDIGIERCDITIWMVYGYKQQCNLEFSPNALYRLGQNGVSLCISCYEMGSVQNR